MLRVMIVDDEPLFRSFLANCIDWEQHGFQIVSEARNGKEALKSVEPIPPDILLADINMPIMNGIELCEIFNQRYPETSLILITGYSEFEYAKSALKLGVVDYILKPVEEEELLAAVMRIAVKKKQQLSVESQTTDFMRNQLLNKLISKDAETQPDQLASVLKSVGYRATTSVFQVSSIEIDTLYQLWDDPGEIRLWKFSICNILFDMISAKGNHILLDGPENRIVSIIEHTDTTKSESQYADDYDRVCCFVHRHFKFTITIGIGRAYEGLDHIRTSYIESLTSLQQKFMLGTGMVHSYRQIVNQHANPGFYSSKLNESLITHLRLNQWEPIFQKLQEVYNKMKEEGLSTDYAIVICNGLISLCLSYVIELGSQIEKVFGAGFNPYHEMKKKPTFDECFKWITDMFRILVEFDISTAMTKSKKITSKAVEWMNNHYNDVNMGIEMLAGRLFIHPGYLRNAFKKEMGITVVDYLFNVRMRKAKELIEQGNIMISEIAYMVGYTDPAYFSKCFKKFYGTSPSTYENKIK